MASAMGGLVQLAHLLWTHLLDQADYGRFAILEGVVFGVAAATIPLAPQSYILVYLHKKDRAGMAGDLGGVLGLAFVVGVLSTLVVFVLPDSLYVLGGEAIPRWAVAGVVIAATLSTSRIMAQTINETQSQPTRAALWSDFVDGTRPFIALALFFLLGWTWEARWGGLVVAQIGAGLAAIWVLRRHGWLRRPPSFESLREPLRYSLPMILAAVSYVGYQSADRLYVALWNGIAAAGRYEASYRVALMVSTVNVVTLHSFNPLFYSAYARGDRAGATKLLRKTSLQVAGWVVLLVVTLPLVVPSILAGAVLGFAKALGEFGATITFVAAIPGQTQTIPTAIYGLLQVPGGEPAVLRLVIVSVVLAMGALLISEWLARRMARKVGRG